MKQVLVVIFLLFSGGIMGLYIGQQTAPAANPENYCQPATNKDIESFYSQTVGVTEQQKNKLLAIEQEYQQEKAVYTKQMVSANNKLADVIEEKGYEASEVALIVMEIHSAMGKLQHLSLKHLAQLETVLTEKQSLILKKYAVQRLRQN